MNRRALIQLFLVASSMAMSCASPTTVGAPHRRSPDATVVSVVNYTPTDVVVERVTFPSKGITVVGNLFIPNRIDRSRKHAALVTVHPFGGVKEQTSGLYAAKLAEQGFITLAFDASYQGESGGEPRLMEVPAARVEDIRAAVDYLSNHPLVDENRIGALGICAGGGYALNATQTEMRIKAVAAVSTFNLGAARREGVGGTISYEERVRRLQEVGRQRAREARGEPLKLVPVVPDTAAEITETTPTLYREGYEYYRTSRAQHPNSPNRYVFTTLGLQMAFFPFEQIETISPRPILLIGGSKADTLYWSQEAYAMAREPKELIVIEGATHIDMYDKEQFVTPAVTKLTDFFMRALRG
ncbi:alpha/beta hydrolase [Archangium lansingense]|uniref:Alpha/beta hydrolase n=1 Tax=Archangium lansingense TaxID=2995310 RepID=A0ABT4ANY3_9BACT|nr:alpha/beta hydrolase [Archangium lansinium]MCY1083418.1 alpha/beta hydrolase [Archangium lansinium]